MNHDRMDLLEHEGKEILKKNGIRVPKSLLAYSPEQVVLAAFSMGFPLILKVQVPVGGRGKAGGIRRVDGPDGLLGVARALFHVRTSGYMPEGVLVEEVVEARDELYLAILTDRELAKPLMLFSQTGGMDVEKGPSEMISWELDIPNGITDQIILQFKEAVGGDGLTIPEIKKLLDGLWGTYWDEDCELVEINPLFVARGGELVAGDAKVIINDDSLKRHPDLNINTPHRGTPFEISCRENGLVGVELGGEVAVVANGAGLTMAVLDEIADAGMKGACFLDLGGTDDPKVVETAILLASNNMLLPSLKCVLVCIFGGITRCDVVAEGIIGAMKKNRSAIPMVVRLRGVNELGGNEMLMREGIAAHLAVDESVRSVKKKVGI